MKKFLSKVLTLALVCAIVVTGTSITSEAKGKKSSKKAKATVTTYSNNAVVNDFIATGIKSNGLVIGGKSYDSQQLITLGFAANPAVTVSPMYWQTDGTYTHSDGSVSDTGSGRLCGFYLRANGTGGSTNSYADFCANYVDYNSETIYGSDISERELNDMNVYGYTDFDDWATLSTNGVWNTNAFIANGINAQYICSWMQSRGLNTSTDIYNYLVANGATFTVDTGLIDNTNTTQAFVCVQCPYLHYEIDNLGTRIFYDSYRYNNSGLPGVNGFGISSDSEATQWYSSIQH